MFSTSNNSSPFLLPLLAFTIIFSRDIYLFIQKLQRVPHIIQMRHTTNASENGNNLQKWKENSGDRIQPQQNMTKQANKNKHNKHKALIATEIQSAFKKDLFTTCIQKHDTTVSSQTAITPS